MEPTDKSSSPAMIRKVIPIAMMPISTVCRTMLIRLTGFKNTGDYDRKQDDQYDQNT